jgi:Flp pilus assembly protein CpaB
VAATITLEVPAGIVGQVVEAKARGGMMLALRSYADMGGGPERMASGEGSGIRVIKGSTINQVTVSR